MKENPAEVQAIQLNQMINLFDKISTIDLSAFTEKQIKFIATHLKDSGKTEYAISILKQYIAEKKEEPESLSNLLCELHKANGDFQKAFTYWQKREKTRTPNILHYVREGMSLASVCFQQSEDILFFLVDDFCYHTALEISLLRKIAPKNYNITQRLVHSNLSRWQNRKDRGIYALQLSVQLPQKLFENQKETWIHILNTFNSSALSKLFRHPLFKENSVHFVNWLKNSLDQHTLSGSNLSPQGFYSVLVLAYVMTDKETFERLLNVIRDNLLDISDFDNLSTHAGALTRICNNFLLAQKIHYAPRKTEKIETKLKIALCISGQMRGYQLSFPTWKHLGLSQHDVSTFIHTWKDSGRRFPDPHIVGSAERSFEDTSFVTAYLECCMKYGLKELQKAYPSFFEHITNGGVITPQILKKVYGSNTVIAIDDEADTPFNTFNNMQKMHYKIFKSFELAQESKTTFDLIIRIRPDKMLGDKPPQIDWHQILHQSKSQRIVFTEEPTGLREDLVIGDQLAVGATELIELYSNAWCLREEAEKNKWHGYPHTFMGHTSLAYTLLINGIRSQKCPNLDIKRPVDPSKFTNKELSKLLLVDIKKRDTTEMDKILLAPLGIKRK